MTNLGKTKSFKAGEYLSCNSGFSQTHNIGSNANIGIRGFTTSKQKKSNDKILPSVGIEPIQSRTLDNHACFLFYQLTLPLAKA